MQFHFGMKLKIVTAETKLKAFQNPISIEGTDKILIEEYNNMKGIKRK